MTRQRKHGGKRSGAGRSYAPWFRIGLANRYEELLREAQDQGVAKPGSEALYKLHRELRRKGPVSTIKGLIRIGRQERETFTHELYAKRHNQEPLSDLEQKILRQHRLRWLRWQRRWRLRKV